MSLPEIFRVTEEEAYQTFCQMRWPENAGEPYCPVCGCFHIYNLKRGRQLKCAGCGKEFTVTSGTIFHSRKMSYRNLLAATFLAMSSAKGQSAITFSRQLGVQYKTAWVLYHKLREAMGHNYQGIKLWGEVELDGMYWGARIRKANWKKNRKPVWAKKHAKGTQRVVIVMRERGENGRTKTFITKSEADGVNLARQHIKQGSTLYSDDARHWTRLNAYFSSYQINHEECYSQGFGLHSNGAESFFARLRTMLRGQHRKADAKYLHLYANHAAWLEDNRRITNGQLLDELLTNVLKNKPSSHFCGYWQQDQRQVNEILKR